MQIPSYPKVYNLGHPAVTDLFRGEIRIEEKVDGSQFSFMRAFDTGELLFRSRGADIDVDAPPKMFAEGVAEIKEKADSLVPGYIYRGEYLSKPKHNTLVYNRIPQRHVILFDVEVSPNDFLPHETVKTFAETVGLESTPLLYEGVGSEISADWLRLVLDRESILGGPKIEGVVIKARGRFGLDGKLLIGKHVSEAFKESHTANWRNMNPTQGDIITQLILAYRNDARWMKSIQHLQEGGKLLNAPQDIGPLLGEIRDDLLTECGEEIRQALMKYAWPRIVKGVQSGFAQWYKNRLMESQFEARTEGQPEIGTVGVADNSGVPGDGEVVLGTSGEVA